MKIRIENILFSLCCKICPRKRWPVGIMAFGLLLNSSVNATTIKVTIENLAPEAGTHLTPVWIGFHDGSFDLFDEGETVSEALESLAEDGDTSSVSGDFGMSAGGVRDATITGPGSPPVFFPGDVSSRSIFVDGTAGRYFSFASMIIPSNDAFIANGDPMAYEVFDGNGNFIPIDIVIMGSQVWDAGSEVNDEVPANVAFLAQAAPDTGVDEEGTVHEHVGFLAGGEILTAFPGADFSVTGYEIARITIEEVPSRPVNVEVAIENLAPDEGTHLTPFWVGFHDGSFDLFNEGEAVSAGLESLAEDGSTGLVSADFAESEGGSRDTTITGPGSPPVFFPGNSNSTVFTLDASSPLSRYFSFASMIIPSNDAFVGNDDPLVFEMFDEEGNFIETEILIMGSQVWDAGSEVNDEVPANVAFLEQAAPNTGESEDGIVQFHEGFSDEGAILDAFPNADFTIEDYEIVRITITEKPATSVEVLVTISNLAPAEGTHLTPFWVGFHDGSFNLFDEGAAASPGLESTAEDGATALLSAEFANAALGFEDATIIGPGPPPVFFPGNTSAFKFSLDSSSPLNRYFSFASMIIPSNDAFIGNGDPMAYEVFDESGNFVMTEIIILGTQVWDAGTEVNDEVPANVAFLEQAAPNTGPDENGTVQFHSGFASGGAILTAFPNADFTAGGYQVARISLSSSLLLEGSALFVNDGTLFQGNIYDGFELNGSEATFSSFPGEITRVAFLDPDGDLVFVEFGSDDPNTTLTISLQDFAASVPSPYNQPGKTYVQGLATITIENSTSGTYLSVFTLGNDPDRVDTAIISGSTFSGNVDGIADIKSISVESPDGQVTMIGGINAANANFVGLAGVLQFIGINAPDVIVTNFLLIGDLSPSGQAAPRIVISPSSTIQEISITGGDLREAVGSRRIDTDDVVYSFSFTASSGQRSISDSSLRPDLGDGRLDAATDTFASDVDSYFLTDGQSSGIGQ